MDYVSETIPGKAPNRATAASMQKGALQSPLLHCRPEPDYPLIAMPLLSFFSISSFGRGRVQKNQS